MHLTFLSKAASPTRRHQIWSEIRASRFMTFTKNGLKLLFDYKSIKNVYE